jgi:tetratricopeptide (TPR) repeat protein
VVVIAVAGWFGWSSLRERRAEAENKRLGTAYVLLRQENPAAAEQALRAFLASNPSGLARDKANLFLGKLLYRQERYDEALQAYELVEADGKPVALIGAGALHGRAAVYMQKSDYARAAGLLDELVNAYGARTGDPRENLAGEEVVDFSPNVPNALWKLALCRRALGETDKARAAAERLVRAYPGSREAQDAEKLIATL